MREVITQLESLRRRGWLMLFIQRCAVVIAWFVGATIALVFVDYMLRFPATVRAVLLAGGLVTIGAAVWQYVLPAVRFRPTLTQLALRVERALPAMAGRLASSIEFAVSGVDQSNALAARSIRDAQSRMEGESVAKIIAPKRTLRDMGVFAGVVILGMLLIVAYPAAAQTGLSRLFVPFGSAQWPARTGVTSLMQEVLGDRTVHPRGQALPLRAQITRGDNAQRVTAQYRLQIDGAFRPWQQVVLTQQGASTVHERLIDTSGGTELIEVHFATQDDHTEVERIPIVMPPAIRRASLHVSPPAYAAEYVPPYETELGPGTDNRAQTESPSLHGSRVRIELYLNKPLPPPDDVRTTFDWDDDSEPPVFSVHPQDASRWALSWTLDQTRTLRLTLVDEYGLRSAETIAYRIDAVADRPPTVTITQPQADDAVLATAVVRLVAEAQDDIGVAELAMEGHVRRVGESEPSEESIWSEHKYPESARSASIQTNLDLATLSLREGDVLFITGRAQDAYQTEDGARPPTISSPRRIRIISELELETHIRRQLSSVRQNAIRLEAAQHDLQERVAENGTDASTVRAQAQLSERIAAQRAEIDRIEQILSDNRMEDAQLESLMQQSADLLDFAGRASNRASSAMAEQQAEPTPEREREISEQQQEVRDELTDLIELLDRDEDAWVVTRQLESLLRDQAELQDDSAQMSERTMGRSLSELTPGELSELDRIAQRQRELRDRAREMIDDLRERAQQLENVDPQAAAGMREAARTAEQRELDRDMDDAAQRAEQNQMRNAQQSQQSAASTMQRMLEDIEHTQRARAEQLLRQLASLLESIERLIVVQENELIALANAREHETYTDRDRAMIRLHQNTQSVAGEARSIGQQARRIARTLDRAADAQGTAISALRAMPIQVDDADDAESRSLELLKEAKALAEELEQQTQEEEAERQREELLDAYRAFAERQVVLRDQTLELQQHEQLDRRQVVEARRIGAQQEQLRTGLYDLQRATQEILDSLIFSHVHSRIDNWSRDVSRSLDEGNVGARATGRQQLIADSIGRLIQALEDASSPAPDFDTGEGGSQGEGQGGGAPPLVPPLAELRLLRGLQEQVYNQTRELDAHTELSAQERQEMLREVGTQQRELIDLGRQMMEQLEQRSP